MRPAPPLPLVLRGTRGPARADTRVRYAVDVTARKIDRDEWARQVARLVTEETGGNKSRFAALVGVTYKTVNRWLRSEGSVREENVREVARALGISPADLLIQVGYYAEAELRAPRPASQPPTTDIDDDAVRMIVESKLPPNMKRRMLERLRLIREARQTEESDEVRFWIEQARAQGGT